MTLLPHLAARLGVPLAIHRPKLDVILAVLGPLGSAFPIWPLPWLHAADVRCPGRRPVCRHPHPRHAGAPHRGLEAESGLTSYAGSPRNWMPPSAIRRCRPSCSTSIRRVASRVAFRSGRPHPRAPARSSRSGPWPMTWPSRPPTRWRPPPAGFSSRAPAVSARLASLRCTSTSPRRDAQDGVHYTAVFAGDRKTISTRTSRSPAKPTPF